MITEAIAKINAEMAANANNAYIQCVGQFLLQRVGTDPAAATKVMAVDKTIANSINEMRKVAQTKGGVLPDQEGFDIVLKYFEIGTATASTTFDLNLDELLGGL